MKVPLLVLEASWIRQGDIIATNGTVTFHDGLPNEKSHLASPKPLIYDDYIELDFQLLLEKMMDAEASNVEESDKTNGFFI